MTSLTLVETDPATLAVEAIVIGLHSSTDSSADSSTDSEDAAGPALAPGTDTLDAAFGGRLAQTLTLLGATGAVGEVVKLATLGTITAPLVVAVGLGPAPAEAEADAGIASAAPRRAAGAAETLRRATGAAVRALAGNASVALALPQSEGSLRAMAEGALLGAYRFAGYKSTPEPARRDPVGTVSIVVPDASDATAAAELDRAAIVAAAVTRTRDWVNAAPNELRPPGFAKEVAAAARLAGLDVEVLDDKALRKAGFGGILAVGQGSEAPPRLVRLAYRPPDRVEGDPARHVALVGKGITFDTGGVSIKPAQGMWEMKSDMAGAAAVVATMLAVAALQPNVAVTGYAPMAENMPSGSAYRPGDVLKMYGGKQVEVLNTDAEGRLILADAIVRASEDSPDYLVETSTLTGGQVVALGKRVSGVMGEAELCERVRVVGEAVGEPTWPMPIPDDVRKGMDSDVADILQVGSGMDRSGHMLQGGAFLSEFVPEGLPWAHLDIAGPAFHSGEPTGYWSKGGTGVPVRTLIALIEDIETNG